MSFQVWVNPFQGVAESATSSNVLDCRDAFDISLSFRTLSGTSSVLSYWVSNSSVNHPDLVAENSWSHWTTIIPPSGVSVLEPPLSFRWARVSRPASGASWEFNWVKTVYPQGR
jgi:hypothetical protein